MRGIRKTGDGGCQPHVGGAQGMMAILRCYLQTAITAPAVASANASAKEVADLVDWPLLNVVSKLA